MLTLSYLTLVRLILLFLIYIIYTGLANAGAAVAETGALATKAEAEKGSLVVDAEKGSLTTIAEEEKNSLGMYEVKGAIKPTKSTSAPGDEIEFAGASPGGERVLPRSISLPVSSPEKTPTRSPSKSFLSALASPVVELERRLSGEYGLYRSIYQHPKLLSILLPFTWSLSFALWNS